MKVVDVVCMEFSEVFDNSLDQPTMRDFKKIKMHGIHGVLVVGIQNQLTQRKQSSDGSVLWRLKMCYLRCSTGVCSGASDVYYIPLELKI